jgi:ABC-2 type transport system permease protein
MLVSTALMIGLICDWLIGPLYYRGWALARDSRAQGQPPRRKSFFDRLDGLMRGLSQPVRALTGKDLRVFWRDPVQWSQLLMLFGLLGLYVANIQSAGGGLIRAGKFWREVLSFMNLGVTCFVLSILTTRFVYPMLSLEGREFWIIGLAPVHRNTVVWQKYWLALAVTLLLGCSMATFSCYVLETEPEMFVIALVTSVFLAFGLTSLSVGLGAMTPNFREDNPARIANGLGGTVNVVLSMLYIGATLALEGSVYLTYHAAEYFDLSRWNLHIMGCVAAVVVLHLTAATVPMWLGLRRWRKIEF